MSRLIGHCAGFKPRAVHGCWRWLAVSASDQESLLSLDIVSALRHPPASVADRAVGTSARSRTGAGRRTIRSFDLSGALQWPPDDVRDRGEHAPASCATCLVR